MPETAYDLIKGKLIRAAEVSGMQGIMKENTPDNNNTIAVIGRHSILSRMVASEVFARPEQIGEIDAEVDTIRQEVIESGIPSIDYMSDDEDQKNDFALMIEDDIEIVASADLSKENAQKLSVDVIEGSRYTHVMFSPGGRFGLTIQYLPEKNGGVELEYLVNNKEMDRMTDEEAEVIKHVLDKIDQVFKTL